MKKQKECKKKSEAEPAKEYDCTSCGACCVYFFDDDLVDAGGRGIGMFVRNDDVSQLPKKLVFIYPMPEIGMQDTWLRGKKVDGEWRCKSLEGKVGEHAVCSVYAIRPRTCSNFEPGGKGCIKARQSLRLEN
jgi:Fe-S-cluster containining protein